MADGVGCHGVAPSVVMISQVIRSDAAGSASQVRRSESEGGVGITVMPCRASSSAGAEPSELVPERGKIGRCSGVADGYQLLPHR